jgi:hypothetical protein
MEDENNGMVEEKETGQQILHPIQIPEDWFDIEFTCLN